MEKGQSLPLKDPDKQLLPKEILLPPAWPLEAVVKINTTTGPDWHTLSKSIQKALKTGTYIVGSNNRMGYQLEGGSITHQLQLPSSFVLAGTLQLTPKGKLLVAMADGQVTGGYPRALLLDEALNSCFGTSTIGCKSEYYSCRPLMLVVHFFKRDTKTLSVNTPLLFEYHS